MCAFSAPEGSRPRIAISAGDPAGIGPDVCLGVLAREFPADLVLVGDRDVFEHRAAALGMLFDLPDYDPTGSRRSSFVHVGTVAQVRPGQPDPRNARHVLEILEHAHGLAARGACAALVTAPLSKSGVAGAAPGFAGHTGHLARLCGVPRAVMAFVGPRLRVALVTGHLQLAEVPAAVSREAVFDTLRLADPPMRSLQGGAVRWKVCGLNPHAGEEGLLGAQDAQEIAPAVEDARRAGIDAVGPLPADTVFVPDFLRPGECVLAMYHDQALPVVKRDSFTATVNVTFGLPYVRTSPDHGTAHGLAGTGRANSASMVAAVSLAVRLAGCLPLSQHLEAS